MINACTFCRRFTSIDANLSALLDILEKQIERQFCVFKNLG